MILKILNVLGIFIEPLKINSIKIPFDDISKIYRHKTSNTFIEKDVLENII